MQQLSLWTRAVPIVAALLLNGACQPPGATSALPATGRGGVLRVLIPDEPGSFDPNSLRDEMAQSLAPDLYDSLLSLDVDGRLLPDLAESWQVADGGLTYTFHLRQGVRWHDGRPFGAGDVRFTLEHLKRHPSISSEAIRRIVRIETPDERTVAVRLAEPWAPFLATIAWGGTFILPRHLAGRGAPADHPVGTGPFRLRRWVRGDRIELAANPRFHRPGPFLDRIVYRVVPDSAQAAAALQRGAADTTLTRVPLDLVPRLQRSPGLRVSTMATSSRFYCAFNLTRPPLGDRRVREAINRALDRGELVRRALFGYGAPAYGFYTPVIAWAYNGDAHVPAFDLARARALVAAAGARSRPLELVVPSFSPALEMGALIREQLGAAGLTVHVVGLPFAEWVDRTVRRHDFDLTIIAGSQGPDPENLSFRFGSRSPGQMLGYASPELDAAVAEGAASGDLERRARAYFRAQAILARDLPIAPLAEAVHVTVFRANVRGLPDTEARGLVPANDFSLVRVRP
jgi:peptide/nickel transport system substrate-binding protein